MLILDTIIIIINNVKNSCALLLFCGNSNTGLFKGIVHPKESG